MNSETCACPKCTCQPGADAVERDGQHYCCAACASGHPQGEPCRDADCPCGGTTRPQVAEDRQLDDALKETFPASDPISPRGACHARPATRGRGLSPGGLPA